MYNAIFGELVNRGDIKFPDEASCIETPYGDYQIKLSSDYTTTWSVHQGEHVICEGEDEFHSSVGEAEKSAIEWIERLQSVQQYLSEQTTEN